MTADFTLVRIDKLSVIVTLSRSEVHLRHFEYIIVGSGIAGLFAALVAREHGSVLVLTKGSVDESNTKYAQGGIAAAIGPDDNPELHLIDTLEAGAGLVDEEAARILTDDATARIADLVRFGVPFDSVDGAMALGREGAHSRERILHAGGDSTGFHIELTLSDIVRHSKVTLMEHSQALDIHTDAGAATGLAALDSRTKTREDFSCDHLILATGGCGQLFKATTNPAGATADGVALAYRAGAEVMDMEFMQFHPTALRLAGAPVFLISEAVRGEGAFLLNRQGKRFMPEYDSRAELAPRDIVARAIVSEMAVHGEDHVYLDVTGLPPERIALRFPQILRFCAQHGLDMATEMIPVSPAAHYMMGGVRTNSWGETNVANLFACGETACTRVHGANRLASNSLLETVVFAKRTVDRTLDDGRRPITPAADGVSLSGKVSAPETIGGLQPRSVTWPTGSVSAAPLPVAESVASLADLQSLMWENVGVVRDGSGLAKAVGRTAAWDSVGVAALDRPTQELNNLVLTGRLMAEAALMRQESRGAHYRSDFPEAHDEWQRHTVYRRDA